MLWVRSNTDLWIHCETRHKDHPKPQHMQQHHWRNEPGIFSMLKMCQLKQTLLNQKALPQKLGGCKRGDVWQNGKVSTVSFCVSFGMRDFPTKLCLVQCHDENDMHPLHLAKTEHSAFKKSARANQMNEHKHMAMLV